MKRFGVFIVLVTACVLAQGPAAAVDIFGKFTGIDGESTNQGHEKWIDVLSYSWGAFNPASSSPGSGSGGGQVNFADFSFQKFVDKSSPVLLLDLANGTQIQDALFDVVRPGQDPQTFLQYKFSDVLMTSYGVSGSNGGGAPVESWSLVFGKVEMTYRQQDPKGGLGSPITFSWDVTKNKGDVIGAVPEPSTWAMLVAGLGFVVFFGRNRVRARGLTA